MYWAGSTPWGTVCIGQDLPHGGQYVLGTIYLMGAVCIGQNLPHGGQYVLGRIYPMVGSMYWAKSTPWVAVCIGQNLPHGGQYVLAESTPWGQYILGRI